MSQTAVDERLHFLFAVWMAGGNVTLFDNLKDRISRRSGFYPSFHPVEMFPDDLIGKIPPISMVGALKNSIIAKKRFRALEQKAGIPFSAAYFFQHTYITSLVNFRRRVPHLIAMDGVPLWYAKNELWYTHRYFEPESFSSKVKTAITRSVYSRAYHLLPVSSGVKECLVEDYRIPEKRITVVPYPVDVEKWKFPERPSIARPPEKPFNILFVGGDYLRKGGDLLTTLAHRPTFRDVEFHLVTKDFSGEPAANIFIHTGLKPGSEELMDLYRNADALVVPTRQDTGLIAGLEAMAMGLPVISTRVGGIIDIVVDGETGYFVPKDDTELLAERISRLRASRDLRLDMGVKGRRRVETIFSIDRHVDLILDLMHRAAHRLPHTTPEPILR